MQTDLTGFKNDVFSVFFIELISIQFQIKGKPVSIILCVLGKLFVPVRPRDYSQASVFFCGGVDRYPDSTGGQRFDGPLFAVLMPRGFRSYSCWLGKETAVPECDVGTDNLFHHVQNCRHPGDSQKPCVIGEQGGTVV